MCSSEKLGVDLFKLNRMHYLLVVDYHSQFTVLRVLYTLTVTTIIKHLKQIIPEYGVPKTLVGVDGLQFDHQEFRNFVKQWCFTHMLSSLKYP